MSAAVAGIDLVVLVADKDAKFVVEALLGKRGAAMAVAPVAFEVKDCLGDGDCRVHAVEILRPYLRRARRAMVLFDREGSGREGDLVENVEDELETRLARNGWDDRARVVVLDPELEAWLWTRDLPALHEFVGWSGEGAALAQLLRTSGLWRDGDPKPYRPKEAVQLLRGRTRFKVSSSRFGAFAERASFDGCTDRAFARFASTLRAWFPEAE